ncbi:MAG TPA: hypothetical protein VIT88_13875, partial [Pyrinomonadaceae bacterium]
GYLALAEYDRAANGGNMDGRISDQDGVFASLRLWQDRNKNGISEVAELKPLTQLSVLALDLEYKESRQTDKYGNVFKYRAKVWDAQRSKVGRWAYDVFLKL